jgi:hypothetical protein
VARQKRRASTLAQLRMVAAAALGDVVEQRRRGTAARACSKSDDQLAAERVFVRVLAIAKRRRLRIDHQDVLVDRVDVEQVVLHLADDAPNAGR